MNYYLIVKETGAILDSNEKVSTLINLYYKSDNRHLLDVVGYKDLPIDKRGLNTKVDWVNYIISNAEEDF